jgi:hypothetical protein
MFQNCMALKNDGSTVPRIVIGIPTNKPVGDSNYALNMFINNALGIPSTPGPGAQIFINSNT